MMTIETNLRTPSEAVALIKQLFVRELLSLTIATSIIQVMICRCSDDAKTNTFVLPSSCNMLCGNKFGDLN